MRPSSSLRKLLLRWLAPATALLLVASAVTGYFVAVSSGTLAYDRALLDGALALSKQLRMQDGKLLLDLQPQAHQVLTTDKYDRIFFAVRGPQGELLGGTHDLNLPERFSAPRTENDDWFYLDHTVNGQPVRLAALRTTHERQQVSVLIAETTTKRDRLVREVMIGMLLPEILLVITTLLIVTLGVRHGLRPLEGLRGQLARRSHTDLRPIDVNTLPDEVQPLAAEINGLLSRLDTSLGAQRHFVADAAHQLRTPIAALQAQVEALQQESGTRNVQLEPVLAGVRRLGHLVQQLLALARAEPGGKPTMQALDLASLIQHSADRWVAEAIERDIDLGFELDAAETLGVPLLLEEMLGNIVENALRYTPKGGTVTIRCCHDSCGANIEVDDSGPGISTNERERVFERFVRLDSRNTEGCGLGLAIVRLIARQHGATATISESPQGGTRVSVHFPPMVKE